MNEKRAVEIILTLAFFIFIFAGCSILENYIIFRLVACWQILNWDFAIKDYIIDELYGNE